MGQHDPGSSNTIQKGMFAGGHSHADPELAILLYFHADSLSIFSSGCQLKERSMHMRRNDLRLASRSLAAASEKFPQNPTKPPQTFRTITAERICGRKILVAMGMLLLAAVVFAYPDKAYPNGLFQQAVTYYQITNPEAPFTATSNQSPQQPEMKQPVAGDASIDLEPELLGTAFSDGDQNDMHLRTQWRIEASGDGQVVMDMNCRGHNLIDLRIPGFILDPLSNYLLQVRYFDQSDAPSRWSMPVSFSTVADPKDINANRIPDSQEISVFIDLNADGIDDADQRSIISIQNYDGSLKLALGIETGDEAMDIQAVSNVNPFTLPEPFFSPEEMAYGLLRYKITVPTPGQEVGVIIYLSEPIDSETPWLRYDTIMGWEDISDTIRIDADGTRITRYVTDGGQGDSDGAANGIIVDQCGPLTVEHAAISDTESHTADGVDATTCFIQAIGQGVK
jgi:hypothetical protein